MLFASIAGFAADKKKEGKTKAPASVRSLLKDAKAAIKNGRDQAKCVTQLQEAFGREGVSKDERALISHTQALLNVNMNEAENLKAYLKQQYDTANYFNTLLQACRFALISDSTDLLPDERGHVKPRLRQKNRDILLRYRPNILAGGRFFLRKNDYKKALPYLKLYVDETKSPIFTDNAKVQGDTLLSRASFYATVAAYNCDQPREVLRYIDTAIKGAHRRQRPQLQEYKVRCLQAIGDSVAWLDELYNGCEAYPTHDYFFVQLVENFDAKRQYDYGIELADTMLNRVQDIPLYWYAKSLMSLHKEDWQFCIAMSDSTLRRQPGHVDALYNKGLALVNYAMEESEKACHDLRNPQCRKDRARVLAIYQQACDVFEALRTLLPDDKEKWLSPLYRIYLNLNKGKEFDEIERLMHQ